MRTEKAIARNAAGDEVTATLAMPDAYVTLVDSTVAVVKRVLDGQVTPGYQTPAQRYGAELVLTLPGVTRRIVTR